MKALMMTGICLLGLSTLSADYRGGASFPKKQPYQGKYQIEQDNSRQTSSCPACRAKAGKNYYKTKPVYR